jgi:hypothetical protein
MIALLGCFLSAAQAADIPRIRWNVKNGEEVDRPMAERLYLEASRMIEMRFGAGVKPVRPSIEVHVGSPCPDSSVPDACLAPATADLYLPHWDENAPGALTQATLVLGLLQLLDAEEIEDLTREILNEDAKDFVDVSSVRD